MALTNAMAFSDYMEGTLLGWFKGTAFPAPPTTFYVGLLTATPLDTGTLASPADGTEVTTTSGATGWAGYARQPLVAASGWSAVAAAAGDATGQQIANNAQIPAGGTAWTNNGSATVTITAVGIYDAATAGHLLCYLPLTSAQPIAIGSAFALFANTGAVIQVD